jgi:hypothetical protein
MYVSKRILPALPCQALRGGWGQWRADPLALTMEVEPSMSVTTASRRRGGVCRASRWQRVRCTCAALLYGIRTLVCCGPAGAHNALRRRHSSISHECAGRTLLSVPYLSSCITRRHTHWCSRIDAIACLDVLPNSSCCLVPFPLLHPLHHNSHAALRPTRTHRV